MIQFDQIQNATHSVFVLQIRGMEVNVNTQGPSGVQLRGPIRVDGQVLGGCTPPGWSPSAAALSAVGTREPWVLMPMAALERLLSKNDWDGNAVDEVRLKMLEAPSLERKMSPMPISGFRPSPINLSTGEVIIAPNLKAAGQSTVEQVDGELEPE